MATSSSNSETNEMTHCNICFEAYEINKEDKSPMILPCFNHSICKSCLGQLLVNGSTHFVCPFDKKEFNVKIENIHKNRFIIQYIEMSKTDSKPIMKSPGEEKKTPIKPEPSKLIINDNKKKHYCGIKINTKACNCCDGYCGPNNGCNCLECMKIDVQQRQLSKDSLVNRDNRVATRSNETGKFYCKARIFDLDSDGYCGPNNGPNCYACKVLDEMTSRGGYYSQLVNPPKAKLSAKNRKHYCGIKINPKPCKCCDGYCGPTNGCNCLECMKLDMRQRQLNRGSLVNRDGRVATRSRETGKFYCKTRINHPNSDGYCGPNNGPNCFDCNVLDNQTLYGGCYSTLI